MLRYEVGKVAMEDLVECRSLEGSGLYPAGQESWKSF